MVKTYSSISEIDFNRWKEILKNPDWYLTLVPEMKQIFKLAESLTPEEKEQSKHVFYGFFEQVLRNGEVALGNTGEDFDAERKPIDTAIIHHTSNIKSLSGDRISAMELVRLYAPYYFKPFESAEAVTKAKPIYSGHVRNGQQYFGVYHWIVRRNGEVERLLKDNETGWQAGDWEVNCRSIAIVFDNDYANSVPSDIELTAAADILKKHYPDIAKDRILGHCEVNKKKTTCPSSLFLTTDTHKGWKENLLALI